MRGIPLNGVTPTYETISTFEYPGARPLYIYVKGEHLNVIPGLKEFLVEYSKGWSAGGYLAQRGLIASPPEQEAAALAQVTALKPLTADELK